ERFLIVVDTSVARHDALPPHADVPNAQRWTWLPLTSLQATIFGWEDVLNNPAGWKGKASDGTDDAEDAEASEEGIEAEGPLRGYPVTLPDGVPSRVRYIVVRDGEGSSTLRTEFRISSKWNFPDPTDHIRAGARRVCDHFRGRPHAVLEMDEGGRKLCMGLLRLCKVSSPQRWPCLTSPAAEGLLMRLAKSRLRLITSSRLVEIQLQIRTIFRSAIDSDLTDDLLPEQIAQPIHGDYPADTFAPPDNDEGDTATTDLPIPVAPQDLLSESQLFQTGFGTGGDMLLGQPQDGAQLQDRQLIRKLLLHGASRIKLSKLVDIYHIAHTSGSGSGKKRKKIRPSIAKVKLVCEAAFKQFPRLGRVEGGKDAAVSLKTWSTSRRNQILYHNGCMRACRVSIREISHRRALFHNSGEGRAAAAADPAEPAQPEAPAPPTPPTGRVPEDIVLSSNRANCPKCRCPLQQAPAKPNQRGAVICEVVAEPDTFLAWHVSSTCSFCNSTDKFWRGFVEPTENGMKQKRVDLPHAQYFFVSKKMAVALTWCRRWRYRQYLDRASYQGEAVLLRLLHPSVQVKARQQLSEAWAREILWRRAQVETTELQDRLGKQLHALPLEALLEANWEWYEEQMFQRPMAFQSAQRLAQIQESGDPLEILAVDGNAKLHRRTCGAPYAEVIPSRHLNKLLLRGCSLRPHGTDTLCRHHAAARDRFASQALGTIGRHRLRRALHSADDVCHLEYKF
ncbi:unnamed protein product, partial [Durusdinium trenchii]